MNHEFRGVYGLVENKNWFDSEIPRRLWSFLAQNYFA